MDIGTLQILVAIFSWRLKLYKALSTNDRPICHPPMAEVLIWQPSGGEIVQVRSDEIYNLATQSQVTVSFEAPE